MHGGGNGLDRDHRAPPDKIGVMEWWRSGVVKPLEALEFQCSLRSPKARTAWRRQSLFPLTPALSLGEREDCRQPFERIVRPGFIPRWAMTLPLPKGEGRGEGEEAVGILHTGKLALRCSNTPLLQHSITPLLSFHQHAPCS